jgi:hypothetical protein
VLEEVGTLSHAVGLVGGLLTLGALAAATWQWRAACGGAPRRTWWAQRDSNP